MSNEGGKREPDDYFGIKTDNDHSAPAAVPAYSNSAPAGQVNSQNSANTNTSGASTTTNGTETVDRVNTPPSHNHKEDSRRAHRDGNKRAHKEDGSGRDGHHKDNSGRDHKDRGNHIEDHNRRHAPKNHQPPTGTASSVMDDLEEMECYHGNILEDEIRTVLNKHGDYILRMTMGEGGKGIFVTIIWNEETVNLPIRAKYFETEGGKEYMYTLDNKTRSLNIKDLIRKHTMMAIPVMRGKVEVWLLNPIAKQSWELRPENVELIQKLGEGAFGEVYSGKLRLPLKKFCNVAVKVIKRSANTEAATMELQKEAAIMRKLKHNNIVRFFGMVVKKETIMVVMELINGGALDKYLKKNPMTTAEERTTWAGQIAAGLAYLHMQGIMHRDVACRNCLLDCYRLIAKVSDFGLARAAKEYKLRAEERIPIRWTAPEVVKTYIYTQKADIYAYAILVYEIFSNAALPFEGYSNAQIKEQLHNNAFRPKLPDSTPPKVVEMITQCWDGDPTRRPDLFEVAKAFSGFTPKCDDYEGKMSPSREGLGREAMSREGGKSKEKISRVKRPKSQKTKERGGGKSREPIKSVKSGRAKRQGREGGGPSRERGE